MDHYANNILPFVLPPMLVITASFIWFELSATMFLLAWTMGLVITDMKLQGRLNMKFKHMMVFWITLHSIYVLDALMDGIAHSIVLATLTIGLMSVSLYTHASIPSMTPDVVVVTIPDTPIETPATTIIVPGEESPTPLVLDVSPPSSPVPAAPIVVVNVQDQVPLTTPSSPSTVTTARPSMSSSVTTSTEPLKQDDPLPTSPSTTTTTPSNPIAKRFSTTAVICRVCNLPVYMAEQFVIEKEIIHKSCFRCSHCNGQLTLNSFAAVNRKFLCKPHYFELFSTNGGKYDKAFGDGGFTKKAETSYSPSEPRKSFVGGGGVLSEPRKSIVAEQPRQRTSTSEEEPHHRKSTNEEPTKPVITDDTVVALTNEEPTKPMITDDTVVALGEMVMGRAIIAPGRRRRPSGSRSFSDLGREVDPAA